MQNLIKSYSWCFSGEHFAELYFVDAVFDHCLRQISFLNLDAFAGEYFTELYFAIVDSVFHHSFRQILFLLFFQGSVPPWSWLSCQSSADKQAPAPRGSSMVSFGRILRILNIVNGGQDFEDISGITMLTNTRCQRSSSPSHSNNMYLRKWAQNSQVLSDSGPILVIFWRKNFFNLHDFVAR